MEARYIYKLGHQPQISSQEFKILAPQSQSQISPEGYLISDSYLDVQQSGSLIFVAEILKTWNKEAEFISVDEVSRFIKQHLVTATSEGKNIKKLGLLLPEDWKNRVLSSAKAGGAKKINVLVGTQMLNYGHWKQTKNWLIFLQLQSKTILAKISNYSDQEFWQNLDTKLPAGEMSRGLINLKLGRSLLNLTTKKTVWDPFCGHARLVVSGLDLKDCFYLSDKDGEVLKQEVESNLAFAHEYWQKYGFKQRPNEKKDLAKIGTIFNLDAQNLQNNTALKADDYKHLAIVTEGYLGTNFKAVPSLDQIRQEWKQSEILWQNCIRQAHLAGIPEIIFCLPFYQSRGKQMLPTFVDNLIKNTSYKLADFDGLKYMLYSRKDSLVGHYIVKLAN